MNHRPSGSMSISKAIVGFVNHKYAEGLTKQSIDSYERILNRWIDHMGNKYVDDISKEDIRMYLSWLRTDYQPIRFSGETHPLSPKTIRNIWVTLASFFKWASQEFQIPNPMKDIRAPKFEKAPVDAFTRSEVNRMFVVDPKNWTVC